jgi:GNAT superfamily N-acetyltransferase
MTSSGLSIRQLELADMDAAARVHRSSFDHALPWLTGLHTPEEDRWFYRERMFRTCKLWGAFDDIAMTGVIAFHDDWIEQLYVLPEALGRGVGTELLDVAKRAPSGCSYGRSSGMLGAAASMKREALCWSNKPMAPAMKRKNRTRVSLDARISGR